MNDSHDLTNYVINDAEMDAIRREATEFSGIGLYRYRFDGTVLFIDQGALRILGLEGRVDSPAEVVGRSISDLIIYEGPRGLLRSAIREDGHVRGMEYPFRTLDGEQRWAEHDSFLVRDRHLDEEVIQVIIKDISARKQAEHQIAEERERLAVTLRSIGDGVIATDTQGRVTLLNRVAETLTGWTVQEAMGAPVREVFNIINERTRKPCENPVEKVLQTGGVVGLANHTALIAKDGTERIIADSGAPIRDLRSVVVGVVLVFRDITEQQRLEEEVQRIEKLESVGVLAGGIAHDFNNLLSAILGNISLGKLYSGQNHPAFRLLEQAEKATLRAKDLTQQLLTFARGGDPVRTTANLDGIIRESVGFALSGSNVGLVCEFPDDLWPAEVDSGQIAQVFQNLAINADQAMPSGGLITVRAANVLLTAPQSLPLPPGRYVRIDFVDQGEGIPGESLARIFDPYYTTKKKGSGLGLTICHSIISHHEGHISVRSRPGKGTTFTILLPASEHEPETEEISMTQLPTGGGRVLVMDDEHTVLEVAEQMLRHFGFAVTQVNNGDEAVSAYRAALDEGRPYDLVILDLTIPGGKGGAQTVRLLQQLDPEVRAVASSGYSSDPVMASASRHGFVAALPKPYSIQEFTQLLARIFSNGSEETP